MNKHRCAKSGVVDDSGHIPQRPVLASRKGTRLNELSMPRISNKSDPKYRVNRDKYGQGRAKINFSITDHLRETGCK